MRSPFGRLGRVREGFWSVIEMCLKGWRGIGKGRSCVFFVGLSLRFGGEGCSDNS